MPFAIDFTTTIVAPITGAWIETVAGNLYDYQIKVAPITGAWIETFFG